MICCKPRFDQKKLELYGAIFIFLADFFLLLVAFQEFFNDRTNNADSNNQNTGDDDLALLASQRTRAD